MPDFDKNLDPVLLNKPNSLPDIDNPATKVPNNYAPLDAGRGRALSATDAFFGNGPVSFPMLPTVTAGQLYGARRYATYDETLVDIENQKAYAQSFWDKAGNGVLKGLNLTATTVAGLGGLLYGAAKSALVSHRLADLWDNEVMRKLDDYNTEVDQTYLPNYYTNVEKNASWYSPDNWFTTNFLFDKLMKNSGYAVGAMITGNIVNAALTPAGAAFGGLVARGAALAESSQAFKMFTPILRNTSRAFSLGKNIEAAAILEKEISTIADVASKSSKLAEIASATNNFAKFNDVGRRAAISLFSTAGEASFEALQTQKEFRNNLIEKWRQEHNGIEPIGEDLDNINVTADKVGKMAFFGNMALLGITEYAQLPKQLGSSYRAEKQAANSLMGRADDVVLKDGKYVGAPKSTTRFGKLYDKVGGVTRYVFDPKEAAQEMGQYALQVGSQNYYNKAYQTGDADAWVDGFLYGFVGKDESGEGVGAFVSKEGMESGLLGGLTGGIMQASGIYQQAKATKSNTEAFINSLNNAPSFQDAFKDRLRSANRGIVLQQQQQDAVIQGDELEAKDLKTDMLHNYLSTRVKYGRGDMVMQDIDELKSQGMTNEGLAALKEQGFAGVNDTVDTYLERLSGIETYTRNLEQLYQSTNLRYGGVLTETGDKKYSPEVIDKMVYAASKISDYDKRIPKVSEPLLSAGIDVQDVVNKELTDPESTELDNQLKKIDEMGVLEPDELKTKLKDAVEMSHRRKFFMEEYNDMKNSPEKYKIVPSAEADRKEPAVKVPGIKVTTEEGEFEISTGEEYYAAKRISVKETDGKILDFSRFKILEETPEGNIKIQTPDGKIQVVSKKAFEKVTLGKVSDVTTDNGKFFVETHDHIFTYNRGGGKKVEGRLLYDKATDTLTFKSLDGKFVKKVTRDQFSPKKGFDVAQIYSNKRFTTAIEEVVNKPVSLQEKLAVRNQIIADLHDSSKKRLDEINQKLENNKKKLSETVEALDNLAKTKEGLPRKKFTKAIRKTIDALSKIKTDVEQEIAQLENEREDLQLMLPYFEDLAQNAQELPEKGGELLSELKEQINSLEEMIDNTNDAIKSGKSLVKSVESALENALSLMNDFVRRLKKENPNVPLSIEELQARLERYQGEEGAKQFIEEKLGFTELVIELQDQIEAFGEELNVPNLTKRVESLKDQVKDLESGLNELIVEQMAKQKVLSTLEEYAERIKRQKEEEAKLKKNEELRKQLLGTNSNDTANNVDESKTYQQEAKKDWFSVVGGTMAPSGEDANKPFNQRANRFGYRFNSLENREDIKGVVVTVNTEDQILPGLTAKLVEGTNIPTDGVIALVMVQDNGDGTITLVDEFGNPIPKDAKALDLAVFQVFPESKLTAKYNGETQTMFRDDTPDYVEKSLREQYTKWREARLKETELGEPKAISASFGIPQFVKYKIPEGKEETDHNARTSAQDAGLIDENSLIEEPLVKVATNNDAVSNGTVTFKTPLGRVFLKVPGGLAKLFNTKFTKKKATLIFDVINQLAKNTLEDGTAKTDRSQNLITWLKSAVYWGIPKNLQTGERKEAKFNSIFFEDVPSEDGGTETRLFISGRGASYEFSPSALEQNKDAIIALIEGMYHNANATSLNAEGKYKQPYLEITSLNEKGEPVYKEWKNYQSYLLSNKDADGNKRSGEDIPLTTKFKPLKEEGDTNREGIYFTIDDTVDDYVLPEKPVVKSAPAPQQAASQAPPATNSFKLDGSKEKMAIGNFGDVEFSINGDVLAEIITKQTEQTGEPFAVNQEVVQELIDKKALDFNIPETVVDNVDKAKGKGKDYATALIVDAIVRKAVPSVKISVPSTGISSAPAPVTPAPTTPVSDIERRRQESLNSIVETYDKARDLSIGKATITKADGTTQTISDLKDVVTTGDPFQRLKDQINAIYNAEENTSAAPTQPGGAFANRKKGANPTDEAYRLKLVEEVKKFEGENWNKLEQWLKKNFPNVPVYRVKNVIQATNGRQAWGMFRDGAIYIYQNAEVGTAYHEVFEAVWKMFTDGSERLSVLKEFKGRKGEFTDRETGKKVEFSKATDQQIKEQLAEEFRDYVLFGTIPAKPTTGKPFILKLFSDLVNFIKEFFTGAKAQINTANLFAKIGNGYYKDYIPFETNLSYAKAGITDIEDAEVTADSEFRLSNVPAVQRGEVMQHMTYTLLSTLSRSNQSLFKISDQTLPKKEIYKGLKDEMLSIIGRKADLYEQALANGELTKKQVDSKVEPLAKLYNEIHDKWDEFIEEHEEFLKPYGIEFDENDDLQLSDENKVKESDYVDARKVDNFRKANAAIKLLFGTVPVVNIVENAPQLVRNTIGGATLLPGDKVFITLKNALHDAVNMDDMLLKFRNLAINNPNYFTLYRRLTKRSPKETGVDYSKLTSKHDWQLLGGFWKAMKGQNPDVKTVFILPAGDVIVGDSNLSSAAAQAKYDFMNDMIATIRDGKNPYVSYNSSNQTFNVTTALSKVKNLNPSKPETYTQFLEKIGISFDPKRIAKLKQKEVFFDAVNGIRDSISKYSEIKSLTKKTLDVDKRLMQLGTIQAVIENPEFESTYFNLNGERVQTYLNPNALSNLHDVISKVKNFSELASTAYNYLITDAFTSTVRDGKPVAGGGSLVLRKIFNIDGGIGKRLSNTEDILHTAYVDGTVNEEKGKNKESSKLTYKERFIQELNLNLNGYYLNLVPGDSSLEHATKLYNAEDPFVSQEMIRATGYKKVFEIFKDYFISEVELARDNRKIADVAGRNSKDLRFFKSILGEVLHDKIVANKSLSSEKLYDKYEKEINKAIEKFIEEDVNSTEETLRKYGVVYNSEEGLQVDNIEFAEKEGFTEEDLTRNLRALSVNYMIANIELHKLLYSDPYQYKDELKRVKSFNSPRQALLDSDQANAAMDKVYNEGYEPGDFGYTEMSRNYLNSTAIDDVFSSNDMYDKPFEETDGGGYVSMKANRWIRIKAGNWNEREEEQYKYDVAYYKMVRKPESLTKAEKKKYDITDPKKDFDKFLKLNPGVRSAYTTLKPIVSGNKEDGKDYNDIVLDKFALVPLSFRILHQMNPNSNAVKFAEKMDRENLDYAVYNTGRKVGSTVSTPLYKENGEFNDASFNEMNKVPFSIMGIQTEVPSKEDEVVTQGSQVTKLVTMDMLEAGVPIDFEPGGNINDRFAKWITLSEEQKEKYEIYRLVKKNQEILEAKIEQGYTSLLEKLGLTQTTEGFELSNPSKLIKSLSDEILKRDVNANIFAAFKGYEKGQVVLEATPAYQQIRYVLFSIADKNVISPKISGGLKVQIPSTLFEGTDREAKVIVDKKGKSTNTYQSDFLKFYEDKDGQRVCEVMVGRWFDSPMSDEELLKYLNDTPEGQKILKGVAFRIPTQKQNSIDAFRIKQFLPKEFGDNVVIPSALVKKVGSDFDIDKLSIYFKNIYKDGRGNIKSVPFLGYGEEGRKKFNEMFNKGEFLKKEQMQELDRIIEENKESFEELSELGKLLASKNLGGILSEEDITEMFVGRFTKDEFKDKLINKLYTQSLENAYIESMEDLVSHPLNFKNLVKANSADQMKDITKDILKETKEEQFDYTSVGNMLKRGFMSELRHAFVTGKYAIGIAAIAQTNNAQNQRAPIIINDELLDSDIISPTDKAYLGDGKINFESYNSIIINGKKRPTLSMIKDAENEDNISDVVGQFIDGYVDISKGPWIMQLKATPNVASTWLFLTKLGVPIKTVSYFMNQPIVRDLLRNIESSGYTWLFNDRIIADTLESYESRSEDVAQPTSIPSQDKLFKMLKYNQTELKGEMTDVQRVEQQFILQEFLKYAKMAEHLLHVTQGSNFDTATINDPFIIFKKRMQMQKARRTILSSLDKENKVIPAVDGILENSFIGKLKDKIFDIRDAYSTFLISDRPSKDETTVSTREVLEAVLLPYVGENDRDFVKIARKTVSDLFDWATQTQRGINTQLETILLGKDGKQSAAKEVMEFIKTVKADPNHSLFNNILINSFKLRPGSTKVGSPDNLQIVGLGNKTYDQNQIIFSFNELISNLKETNPQLRGKLLRLAVLQSGLSPSPIAFTTLIPYEDFLSIYNETLSVIDKMPNLADYYTTDVFQRANAKNDDVVPFTKAKLRQSKTKKWYNPAQLFVSQKLKNAMTKGEIPDVFVFSPASREGASEFVTYSWEKRLSKSERAKARRTGGRDHINTVLLKRVKKADGTPLIQTSEYQGKTYENFVYKAINAWGDSFRAKEFYNAVEYDQNGQPKFVTNTKAAISIPSVLDNGFKKVKEVEDGVIESILEGSSPELIAPTTPKGTMKLKNGVTYGYSAINAKMLADMGYTEQEAGGILKTISNLIC